MKRLMIAAAVVALAACGQQTAEAPEPEAPAGPQSLMDQAAQLSAEQQPVFAWQQLTSYQTAHPESQPACTSLREVASRGVIPADVAPDSIYAAHAGSWVFSVQCGPQLTGIPSKPEDHWLVVLAPGAAEPAVVNCAGGPSNRRDMCPAEIPRAAPAPAPAP